MNLEIELQIDEILLHKLAINEAVLKGAFAFECTGRLQTALLISAVK